jgi:hypothetical protein
MLELCFPLLLLAFVWLAWRAGTRPLRIPVESKELPRLFAAAVDAGEFALAERHAERWFVAAARRDSMRR